MRDRLIELIEESTGDVCGGFYGDEIVKSEIDITEEEIERIVDHLLANGAIVPPCKVGDMVYELHDYYSKAKGHHTAVVEREVTELLYATKRGVRPWVVHCWGGYIFNNCDFGDTVFLTKEEAEQALKEREKV